MWRADSLVKTLMLGKIEGRRRRGWHRIRWLDGITDLMDMGLHKVWKLVMDRKAWHSAVHAVTRSQTQLSNWTDHRWKSEACLKEEKVTFLVKVYGFKRGDFCRDQLVEVYEFNLSKFMQKEMRVWRKNYWQIKQEMAEIILAVIFWHQQNIL